MRVALYIVAWIISVALAAVLCLQVHAQFVPPPPVQNSLGESFTTSDRQTLLSIYAMTRAIRAKLFPLEEEQRILRLRD